MLAHWWLSYRYLWCFLILLCDGETMSCHILTLPTQLCLWSNPSEGQRLCQSVAWWHHWRWSLFTPFKKTQWQSFEWKVFRGYKKFSNQCSSKCSKYSFYFKTFFFNIFFSVSVQLFSELFCLCWCIVFMSLEGINKILKHCFHLCTTFSLPVVLAILEGTIALGKLPGECAHACVNISQSVKSVCEIE